MTSNATSDKINLILLPLFGGGRVLENATEEERNISLSEDMWAYFYSNLTIFLCGVIVMTFVVYEINLIAVRQTMRIRKIFLKSILSQDMAWFDLRSSLDFATKMTNNLNLLKDAIGDKLVTVFFLYSAFIFQFILAFIYGWEMALLIGGTYTVLLVGFSVFVGKQEVRLAEKEIESYSTAEAIAVEVFNAIRTVVAYGGEDKEAKRYAENLKVAEKKGIRRNLYSGLQSGIMWFLVYASYGLGLLYGVYFILRDSEYPVDERNYDIIAAITVVYTIGVASQYLTFTVPHLESMATAVGASKSIYEVIDEKSKIDPFNEGGVKVEGFQGNVEFRNVNFEYPSRGSVKVLRGVNFEVKQGQTIALVGHSGCGKSTCIQILQRLYDTSSGEVLIDGVNIKDFNIAFLRSQIGVVGQEPVLFSTTIGENIKFGHPEASQQEIENAAKIANCHNFIHQLPLGYDTLVGENGAQLSGGQKQRIAIARAIVRNPKILLLDEATSALDTQSERIVQKALDKAVEGRTTLIVSHRLSTIRNADEILVFKQGVIAEKGTHDQLMTLEGVYYNLRMAGSEGDLRLSDDIEENEESFPIEPLILSNNEPQESVNQALTPYNFNNKNPMKEIFQMYLTKWKFLVIGCLGSVIVGAAYAVSSVFYASYFNAFTASTPEDSMSQGIFYTTEMLILALVTGIAAVFQSYSFGRAGTQLTTLLRKECFKTALKQEMAWFDVPENSVGSLTTRLSTDCASVSGALGSRLGGIFQALSVFVIGIAIGLFTCWDLALVVAAILPLPVIMSIFEVQYNMASVASEKNAMENASRIAMEAIINVRTVASLGLENYILEKFIKEIDIAGRAVIKGSRLRGFTYSANMLIYTIAYSLAFLYAPIVIAKGTQYVEVIRTIEAILYGGVTIGIILNSNPNASAAISSARRIVNFLNAKSSMEDVKSQYINDSEGISSSVEFQDIKFRYPTRPETEILRGLNLRLLQRFYDPEEGRVELDGKATVDFPLQRLRSHLGLVSQEPVLFDRTIAENIAYGDNSREVSMEEIITAAKEARIHSEFVTKLPLGYETPLGSRGTQLSGGQKQRIAIARALVRKPKILLLDEATSALDAESEKTVQAALDKASEQRTCIVIAHRLSSIRNADLICVIDRGQISECGTHDDLINYGGIYAKLYNVTL
ncbi:multidrug resistance protein 1-like [Sergentomyia squamirostris]